MKDIRKKQLLRRAKETAYLYGWIVSVCYLFDYMFEVFNAIAVIKGVITTHLVLSTFLVIVFYFLPPRDRETFYREDSENED